MDVTLPLSTELRSQLSYPCSSPPPHPPSSVISFVAPPVPPATSRKPYIRYIIQGPLVALLPSPCRRFLYRSPTLTYLVLPRPSDLHFIVATYRSKISVGHERSLNGSSKASEINVGYQVRTISEHLCMYMFIYVRPYSSCSAQQQSRCAAVVS